MSKKPPFTPDEFMAHIIEHHGFVDGFKFMAALTRMATGAVGNEPRQMINDLDIILKVMSTDPHMGKHFAKPILTVEDGALRIRAALEEMSGINPDTGEPINSGATSGSLADILGSEFLKGLSDKMDGERGDTEGDEDE